MGKLKRAFGRFIGTNFEYVFFFCTLLMAGAASADMRPIGVIGNEALYVDEDSMRKASTMAKVWLFNVPVNSVSVDDIS